MLASVNFQKYDTGNIKANEKQTTHEALGNQTISKPNSFTFLG